VTSVSLLIVFRYW